MQDNDPVLADLRERMAKIETDIQWIKIQLSENDRRTWYILSGVIVSVLISIFKLVL